MDHYAEAFSARPGECWRWVYQSDRGWLPNRRRGSLGTGRTDPNIVAGALRLTPKGRRAVGQWPDGESGDVLIRALEAAMMNLPEGETRSRVGKLLDAARAVGAEVLSSVVSSVVKGTMGLP